MNTCTYARMSTGMLELSNRRHGLAIDFRIRTEDPRSARS